MIIRIAGLDGCRALRARHRSPRQGEERGAIFIFSLRPSRSVGSIMAYRKSHETNIRGLNDDCERLLVSVSSAKALPVVEEIGKCCLGAQRRRAAQIEKALAAGRIDTSANQEALPTGIACIASDRSRTEIGAECAPSGEPSFRCVLKRGCTPAFPRRKRSRL